MSTKKHILEQKHNRCTCSPIHFEEPMFACAPLFCNASMAQGKGLMKVTQLSRHDQPTKDAAHQMRPYTMRSHSITTKRPFETSKSNKAPVRVSATHLYSIDAPQLKKNQSAEDEEKPTKDKQTGWVGWAPLSLSITQPMRCCFSVVNDEGQTNTYETHIFL